MITCGSSTPLSVEASSLLSSRNDTPRITCSATTQAYFPSSDEHETNPKSPSQASNAVSLSNLPIPRRKCISPNRSEEETFPSNEASADVATMWTPQERQRTATQPNPSLTPHPAPPSTHSPLPIDLTSTALYLVTAVFVRMLLVPKYLTRGRGGPASKRSGAATAKQKGKKAKENSTATVPLSACFHFHPADLREERGAGEPPQLRGSRFEAFGFFDLAATGPAPGLKATLAPVYPLEESASSDLRCGWAGRGP